jgi:RNase H-like domain found in reverse transcriptase
MDTLKTALTTSPILALPREGLTYILDCDASDKAIGSVLSQVDDSGREYVLSYNSRKLSPREVNYCVTRRELLSVIYVLKYHRHFLLGNLFIIRTDHSALLWLL